MDYYVSYRNEMEDRREIGKFRSFLEADNFLQSLLINFPYMTISQELEAALKVDPKYGVIIEEYALGHMTYAWPYLGPSHCEYKKKLIAGKHSP